MADTSTRTAAERLSSLDEANLLIESIGAPMHVAALAMLDARAITGPDGRLPLDALRREILARVSTMPRLLQVLAQDGHGRWYWRDGQRFDIADHVHVRPVDAPGDERSLLESVCAVNEPPLDRRRPVWEIWFLPGVDDGRVGMLIRFHHVLADGGGAVDLLGALFDGAVAGRDAGGRSARPPIRPAGPGARRRVVPSRLAGLGRQVAVLARAAASPPFPWNRPVGRRRRLVLIRCELDAVRDAAHRFDARVDDVLLTAMAGGVRRLLGPGVPDARSANVSVAASIRRPGERRYGNRSATFVVPIPLQEDDPRLVLRRIAAADERVRFSPPVPTGGRMLQRWTARAMFRQRLVHLLLSNVPGPPDRARFAGAEVLEVFPVGLVQGDLALAVDALSYAGQLNLTVVADPDVVSDPAAFAAGAADALIALGVPVRAAPAGSRDSRSAG